MSKAKVQNTFQPMRLREIFAPGPSERRLTVTATLKGDVVDEFEKMMTEYGLNRSQLLVQMVHHCMGRTESLRDFYRRLAILGE